MVMVLLPEVALGESATGAGFEVFFECYRSFFMIEREISD